MDIMSLISSGDEAKKLIMSIPSEVKNLNAKCADTAFFFIWGAKKNVNAEKRKGD